MFGFLETRTNNVCALVLALVVVDRLEGRQKGVLPAAGHVATGRCSAGDAVAFLGSRIIAHVAAAGLTAERLQEALALLVVIGDLLANAGHVLLEARSTDTAFL